MLIFLIILAVIAIVLCTISLMMNAQAGNTGASILMLLLIGLNTYILVTSLNKLNNKPNNSQDEVKTYVLRDVKEYHVDSTTVINGVDTTKTYTITFKLYEQ